MEITKQQYEYALNRIEELLPLVTDETPASDKNAVELTIVSDVVEAYEKIHYPIAKPTIGELISLSIEEKGMTQKQICNRIFRRQSKELIKQGRTPPVRSREVKNSWTFSGEAKIYFGFNYIDIARLLRKWS